MLSPSPPSTMPSSADDEGARAKRMRGSGSCSSDRADQGSSSSQWRTPRAQQTYSSKLLHALRLVRGGGGGGTATAATTTTCSAPAVRDAAYRALAVAARGRSRWSRAILARRRRSTTSRCRRTAHVRLRARPRRRRRQQLLLPQQGQGGDDSEAEGPLELGLAGRAKVLGQLVPGCRSLSLPALLAEVSDYIAALEMQVRAMGQLTHDLASSSPSAQPPTTASVIDIDMIAPASGL